MSQDSYTFEEDEEADIVYVHYHAPCGTTIRGVAIILEPKSANPILKLLNEDTGEYNAGLGMNGISTILDYIQEKNWEMD